MSGNCAGKRVCVQQKTKLASVFALSSGIDAGLCVCRNVSNITKDSSTPPLHPIPRELHERSRNCLICVTSPQEDGSGLTP